MIAQLNETLFSDPKPVQEAQRSLGYKYWSGACVVEKIEKTYFIGCRAKDANASAGVYAVEIVGYERYKLYAVNAEAADRLIEIESYRGSIPAVTILDAFDAADDP
ncbi:MAG: hypothetical protein LBC09_00770 [Helicobacteraceae bacterium]|nr:hypothetical protein [Helicobacteraceae bacterium]